MKLSYNWLSEFVAIDDIDPEEIALKLTMSTAEVEGIERVGEDLKNVVVGRILELVPHPNADHLYRTKVDVGSNVLDIVSGAPNTRKGSFVPVALVGARLPCGMEVKKARLRGVDSFGVVCSEKELGASDEHTGLWILDDEDIPQEKLTPGTAITSLFPLEDHIIEIDNKSITHRPDLWGHYGIARELAAVYRRELEPVYPDREIEEVLNAKGDQPIHIDIRDKARCPRYTAIMIDGIEVKRSPFRLRRRLFTLGMRPIANIVDITNYVMMAIGQPLHAFDASNIAEHTIVVRTARKGERFTTLDGIERHLSPEMLLIADPRKAIAIAGVMGGLNSEIAQDTKTIIIESANFNPVSIRRTALRLGLRTEASNRFEKSLDPELTVLGIAGTVSLIKKLLPCARFVSALCDKDFSEKKKIVLPLDTHWVSELIGSPLEKGQMTDILERLQFDVEEVDKRNVRVTVPSFRATKDVSIPQDLVEEIARIQGYDKIVPRLPQILNTPPLRNELLVFIRELKAVLAQDLALTEVYTYSFQEDSVLDLFYPENSAFVRLKNPVSMSLSRLRRSLIPGLYSLIEKNLTYKQEFSVFEIGSVYAPPKPDSKTESLLPDEQQMAASLFVRKRGAQPVFFHAKGRLEALFRRLSLQDVRFVPFERMARYKNSFHLENIGFWSAYHAGRSALLVHGDTCIGIIAELEPFLLKRIGLDYDVSRVAVFEVNLHLLNHLVLKRRQKKKFSRLPRYPEVVLAFAVVVDEKVPLEEVKDFIMKHRFGLIDRIEPFDIYRGKPLPDGRKSLAFNVYYRAEDRTLTEEEAEEVHERIAKRIREHGWDLR